MAKLRFKKEEIEIKVQSGSEMINIQQLCAEFPVKFGCRRGECGVCAVKIMEGLENITKSSPDEEKTLLKKGFQIPYRLACQFALNGDVLIETIK